MIIENITILTVIGILLGVIGKYLIYKPLQESIKNQKESNEKLTDSISESNDRLTHSITDLATVIGDLKIFTAVQTEKNINDKEKFEILFEKSDKYQITLTEQAKTIEANRINIAAAEGSLKGLWKAHYNYSDKVDNHTKQIEDLYKNQKDKENV